MAYTTNEKIMIGIVETSPYWALIVITLLFSPSFVISLPLITLLIALGYLKLYSITL